MEKNVCNPANVLRINGARVKKKHSAQMTYDKVFGEKNGIGLGCKTLKCASLVDRSPSKEA